MNRIARIWRWGMLPALAGALVASGAGAVQNGASGAAPSPVVIQREVSQLCAIIRREIGKLPATPGIEDAEAAIVYALSQANARGETIDPALTCSAGGEARPNVLQAIDNVRRSYRRTGTGAINEGTRAGASSASFFSPPIVGIGGGGGANYSAR